jgi:adenylate kinase family enzyme
MSNSSGANELPADRKRTLPPYGVRHRFSRSSLEKSVRPLLVCVSGPPGAGKTTLISGLVETFGGSVFSLREALRTHRHLVIGADDQRDELGWVIDDVVARVLEVTSSQLVAGPHPMFLDNFPGRLTQLDLLGDLADRHALAVVVLELDVNDSISTRRAAGRRVCPRCQPDLHFPTTFVRDVRDHCSTCGTPVVRRSSDDPGRHMLRLRRYRTNSRCLDVTARSRGIPYRRVSAGQPADAVSAIAVEAITELSAESAASRQTAEESS